MADRVLYGQGSADFQQAEWLAYALKDEWRFDFSSEVWHHWDGVRWAVDKTNAIHRVVSEEAALHLLGWETAVKHFGEDKALALFGDRRYPKVESEPLRKALSKLQDLAPVERALKALATLPGYGTDGSDWDTDPYLLGVENGIVDLRLNALIPHPTPDILVTKSTGVKFDPIAGPADFARAAPRFIDVLSQWTADWDESEDASMMAFLLLWYGASLFGYQPEQRFLMLTGAGRNGKGALRHAVMQAVGPEYGMQPDANLYSRSKFGPARSNEARADLLSLKGKRVAFFSEPDKGQFNEELLKAHTGGDIITARGLYQRVPVSWEPTHSISFLVNDTPAIEDVGPSMGSRVMVADFRHRWDGKREDKNLYPKLTTERAGILSILCWAAKAWYERYSSGEGGLELPQRVIDQSKAFIERNDPVAECLRDAFIEGPDLRCSGADAYGAYKDWHTRSGMEGDPISLPRFTTELEKKGFQRYRNMSARGWNGLRPMSAVDLAESDPE